MGNTITINEVENLIEVRSEPHIYVFSTNTIPKAINNTENKVVTNI